MNKVWVLFADEPQYGGDARIVGVFYHSPTAEEQDKVIKDSNLPRHYATYWEEWEVQP